MGLTRPWEFESPSYREMNGNEHDVMQLLLLIALLAVAAATVLENQDRE